MCTKRNEENLRKIRKDRKQNAIGATTEKKNTKGRVDPFRTAVPFWGHVTWDVPDLFICSPKKVRHRHRAPLWGSCDGKYTTKETKKNQALNTDKNRLATHPGQAGLLSLHKNENKRGEKRGKDGKPKTPQRRNRSSRRVAVLVRDSRQGSKETRQPAA